MFILISSAPRSQSDDDDEDDVELVINSRDKQSNQSVSQSKKGPQLEIDQGVSDLKGYFSDKKHEEISKILDVERLRVQDLDSKTFFKPGVLAQTSIAPSRIGKRAERRKKLELKEATSGKNWYDMPRLEETDEIKKDLEILKLRGTLDPARHFRKSDRKRANPKYFHVGTIVETAADFYSGRLPKKDRKQTLVEELMADAKIKQRLKKKLAKREAITKKIMLRKKNMLKKKKQQKDEKVKGRTNKPNRLKKGKAAKVNDNRNASPASAQKKSQSKGGYRK